MVFTIFDRSANLQELDVDVGKLEGDIEIPWRPPLGVFVQNSVCQGRTRRLAEVETGGWDQTQALLEEGGRGGRGRERQAWVWEGCQEGQGLDPALSSHPEL